MRTTRFQPFAPSLRTSGLRRLKTAFSQSSTASPVSSTRSFADSAPRSAPSSCSSTGTASPLESDCDCCNPADFSSPVIMGLDAIATRENPTGLGISRISKSVDGQSARSRLRALLMRRRRAVVSKWDVRLEEEMEFGPRVMVFEPRRKGEIFMASIFEVLEEGKW